jgi:hypothetical protein
VRSDATEVVRLISAFHRNVLVRGREEKH